MQGVPEQQLDMGVEAAQIVGRPLRERVVNSRVEPEQYGFPLPVAAPGRAAGAIRLRPGGRLDGHV